MVRCAQLSRLGMVALVALLPVLVVAKPPGGDDESYRNTLALQQAMEKARHFLIDGNSEKAVETLEEQLPRVNGHGPYLRLLRETYRTHVKNLGLANRPELAKKYLDRLCIIEPSAANDATLRPPVIQPGPNPVVQVAAPAPKAPPRIFPNFSKTHPETARGKVEDDPFDPVHERPQAGLNEKSRLAQQIIAKANVAYEGRRFEEARNLYDQAYQADARSIDPCRDSWAYCMLNRVVDRLNSPNLGGQSLADLQQQVHGALALAPKLDKTGQWLLKEIDQRHKTQVAAAIATGKEEAYFNVQHYAKNPQGWFVAETPRFRIYHNQPRELVDKAAQIAERTALTMARKWLGKDQVDWSAKCEIVLHAASADYTKMTGVSSTAPGHAQIESDSTTGRVISRRLHLRCDHPEMLTVTLPHETTHVVLAGHCEPHAIPRWADEGIASLSEPAEKVEKYRRAAGRLAANGQLFSLRDLLNLNDYPERRRIDAFYVQSVMLVEYLATLRGPTTLPEFLKDALRTNYEAALQKHYSMDLNDLQTRWEQRYLSESKSRD